MANALPIPEPPPVITQILFLIAVILPVLIKPVKFNETLSFW